MDTENSKAKKVNLKSLSLEELTRFFEQLGEPKYRAIQVFRWIAKGVYTFDEMTNLSLALRSKLKETATIEKLELIRLQRSEKDGTRKYLFGLHSGHAIESVFLKYKYGNSVCVSSQAGCRMGCTFCASGIGGLAHNLTPAEMLDQVIAIEADTGERISHIVVMGTGEPFDNYETLLKFLELVHEKEGLNISLRSITVSTCGIIPKIEAFGKAYPQVNLAISLHGPNDLVRGELMPINQVYPIDQLLAACKQHTELTSRRITFEYALIRGVNDQIAHAKELAERLAGHLCHVNLIPLNPVSEKTYVGGDRAIAEQFQKILEAKGISTTIRRDLGTDIDAACGQLRLTAGK